MRDLLRLWVSKRPTSYASFGSLRAIVLEPIVDSAMILAPPSASMCIFTLNLVPAEANFCQRYWLNGNCLAGDSCPFSHDLSATMARLTIEGAATPPMQIAQPNLQDFDSFPSLQAGLVPPMAYMTQGQTGLEQFYASQMVVPPPGLNPLASFTPNSASRPHSRPGSRHASRAPTPSIPAVDDNDAFPALGSAANLKAGKKHHGKRGGHGHAHKESPSSLADVVRMSPSPSPAQPRRNQKPPRGPAASRELNAAAHAIPTPEEIPWMATGDAANKAYLKARAEAFKLGGLRNKFLQRWVQGDHCPIGVFLMCP
jgi:hypothetical protein